MIISGYGITEEKRQHFVEYVLCSNNLTIPNHSSTMTEQLVFKTGKKAKKDEMTTNVARIIDML